MEGGSVTKILLIDSDPIFRLGLRGWLEQFEDLQIVAEAERLEQPLERGDALPALELDLLVWGVSTLGDEPSIAQICQSLQAQYLGLPILLLGAESAEEAGAIAQQAGVNGYCPKGGDGTDLLLALRQVSVGQFYRPFSAGIDPQPLPIFLPDPVAVTQPVFPRRLAGWQLAGSQQIETELAKVTAQLQTNQLSPLDRLVRAGQRRELLAARWLLNRLGAGLNSPAGSDPVRTAPDLPAFDTNLAVRSALAENSLDSPPMQSVLLSQFLPDPKVIQALLWDATIAKLQTGLKNLTDSTLEIEVLREDKQRELLYIILRKLEDLLDELRFSQVQASQLPEKRQVLLRDLWQAAMTDFLGKYYTLPASSDRSAPPGSNTIYAGESIEVVNTLLQDWERVEGAILQKIPQVPTLLSHLLFQTPLGGKNSLPWAAGTPAALEQAEALLQNLVIQVANAVIQPLLNRFPHAEAIQQTFYSRRLLSTREMERFRNDLSWKYRLETYLIEPTAIFESRYWLFVLTDRGIQKISLHAPRYEELANLDGIQRTVTLALEVRDAIAPRLQATVSWIGSGLVYVLTEVVGRGLGLVGRGILQGIGNAWQEGKFKGSDRRP